MNECLLLKAHQRGVKERKWNKYNFILLGTWWLGGAKAWQIQLHVKQSKYLLVIEKHKLLLVDASIKY